MGCDLPKIHIEWDEAHAAGLRPELLTYRKIVSRLDSHDGVEASLDAADVGECAWERWGSDTSRERDNEATRNLGGGVLHDVRAMCRSLGRLRELGATVTIGGRDATTAVLDAYEDTLAREICRLGGGGAGDDSGDCADSRESGGSFLSTIIYIVGLAVVLQWFFSCS